MAKIKDDNFNPFPFPPPQDRWLKAIDDLIESLVDNKKGIYNDDGTC